MKDSKIGKVTGKDEIEGIYGKKKKKNKGQKSIPKGN